MPELHHLKNVIVFPTTGPRPHPDEIAGGDLDGDQFFVSWDVELTKIKPVEPMNYTPVEENIPIPEADEVVAGIKVSRLSLIGCRIHAN